MPPRAARFFRIGGGIQLRAFPSKEETLGETKSRLPFGAQLTSQFLYPKYILDTQVRAYLGTQIGERGLWRPVPEKFPEFPRIKHPDLATTGQYSRMAQPPSLQQISCFLFRGPCFEVPV